MHSVSSFFFEAGPLDHVVEGGGERRREPEEGVGLVEGGAANITGCR